MSLLGWFSRKIAGDEQNPSTTLPRDTRLAALGSSRKRERYARRERLYAVVREAMVNAGVLSSAYRFKALSLDGRGRQFLVMVDLAEEPGSNTAEPDRIEASIAQVARAQHGIVVKGVYWRKAPAAGGTRASAAEASKQETSSGSGVPAAGAAAPVPPTPASPPQPSRLDKRAALEQALAAGDARPHAKSFDGAPVQGPQSYTLLTGFEDTELGLPTGPAPGAGKAKQR